MHYTHVNMPLYQSDILYKRLQNANVQAPYENRMSVSYHFYSWVGVPQGAFDEKLINSTPLGFIDMNM